MNEVAKWLALTLVLALFVGGAAILLPLAAAAWYGTAYLVRHTGNEVPGSARK